MKQRNVKKYAVQLLLTGSIISMACLSLSDSPLYAADNPDQNKEKQEKPEKKGSITTSEKDSNLLSFSFQNIEIRSLLQLIAKSSGLNFIISDAVKGNITLNLKDVTWKEALEVILKTYGLSSRQVGNIVYVSSIEQITQTEAKHLQSQETLANLAPLESKIFKLKYINAEDLAALLKGADSTLLSSRGQVAIDKRTNTIILKDTAANLKTLAKTIKGIDLPAKQVLIEARIVNITTNYQKELGVRFGLSDTRHLSGTLDAANELTKGTGVNAIDPFTNRLNFNIAGNALDNVGGVSPATIGLALARLGPVLLDLELSALEGEKHAKTISRPRVVTSNLKKAIIATGEEIPYQEATSSGATSVSFKKALLSLEVTPQITSDNKVMLTVKATEDTKGDNIVVGSSSTTGGTNIPAINTQSVESNILLNNNETVVIGGVYKISKNNIMQRVPFFGDLPLVGSLFRHKGNSETKSELLIFLTPKIINTSSPYPLKGEA